MNNMEKSILEAGGLTGRVYDNTTHSVTEEEHKHFLEWKEARRKQKEKNKKK